MKTLILALLLVSLTGCATYSATPLDGRSQQQVNIDDYQCKRDSTHQAFSMVNGIAASGPELNINLWISCMAAKGYHVTQD
jgi:hypothetical protein